jgi:hypothetical protein
MASKEQEVVPKPPFATVVEVSPDGSEQLLEGRSPYALMVARLRKLKPGNSLKVTRSTKTPIETVRGSLWRHIVREKVSDHFRSFILDRDSFMVTRLDHTDGETFDGA